MSKIRLSRAMRKVQLTEPMCVFGGLGGPYTQVWRGQLELRALDALAVDFSAADACAEQGPTYAVRLKDQWAISALPTPSPRFAYEGSFVAENNQIKGYYP